MTTEAQQARHQVAVAEQELASAKSALEAIEARCKRTHGGDHPWGGVQDTSYTRPGYRMEGDPEGTMGIDRRLPYDVPSQRVRQATRVCTNCGAKQVTENFAEKKAVSYEPTFPR